jgi:hypothetical protein
MGLSVTDACESRCRRWRKYTPHSNARVISAAGEGSSGRVKAGTPIGLERFWTLRLCGDGGSGHPLLRVQLPGFRRRLGSPTSGGKAIRQARFRRQRSPQQECRGT